MCLCWCMRRSIHWERSKKWKRKCRKENNKSKRAIHVWSMPLLKIRLNEAKLHILHMHANTHTQATPYALNSIEILYIRVRLRILFFSFTSAELSQTQNCSIHSYTYTCIFYLFLFYSCYFATFFTIIFLQRWMNDVIIHKFKVSTHLLFFSISGLLLSLNTYWITLSSNW